MHALNIDQQIHVQWERIENWLRAHHPGALQHLNGPASMAELAAAETEIGMPFPASLRASYLIHNGENGTAQALPDGHWLLPAAECVQHWHWQKDGANPRDHDFNENGPAWHNWVATGSVIIDGPVKPLSGSSCWIPITSMNGDVLRYLDLDPAPGGAPGQVIEVDLECVFN